MRKYLCLFMVSSLFLVSACDNNRTEKTQIYPIEQKKKMEKDLNESLERNINQLQNQPDL